MILTDGQCDDMQDTINAIVRGARVPLSIIIVGLGPADFSQMDQLDADDVPLVSSEDGAVMDRGNYFDNIFL